MASAKASSYRSAEPLSPGFLAASAAADWTLRNRSSQVVSGLLKKMAPKKTTTVTKKSKIPAIVSLMERILRSAARCSSVSSESSVPISVNIHFEAMRHPAQGCPASAPAIAPRVGWDTSTLPERKLPEEDG